MSLRRNAGYDQRRRRVLIEENLAVAGTSKRVGTKGTVSGPSEFPGRAYSEAALAHTQPPVVAVLAVRPWTLAVVFLSTLTAFVGLLAAYGQLQLLPISSRPAELLALDVLAIGSLSRWLASLLLVAAAFQGAQIHRLRRHKTDDYRGRYRIWAWIPLVLFLMGACIATGLHRDIVLLSVQWIDPTGAAVNADMWPIGACILWSLVAARLGFEVRDSRSALTLLVLTSLCYFAAAAAPLVKVYPSSHLISVMATTAMINVGHLSLFLMVAVFGRHVYMDSQGLLQQRSRRRKKVRSSEAATDTATQAKASSPTKAKATPEPAQPASKPAEAAPKPAEAAPKPAEAAPKPSEAVDDNVISMDTARQAKKPQQVSDEVSEEMDDSGSSALSKAERRRRRKLERRERRAA